MTVRTTTRRIRTAAVLVWLGLALAIIVRVQDRRDWVRKDQPASERFLALSSINKDAALDVFLKINTGMNRLGFTAAEFPDALRALQTNPGVSQVTLMTHFADADGTSGVGWLRPSMYTVRYVWGPPTSKM